MVHGGNAGGESHFLGYCDSDCRSGLSCISGVCTRSCLVEEPDCDDLHERAVCTNESIEPGNVAVCDVACDEAADCSGLGSTFRCDDGYCRGASGTAMSGTGGADGSSGANGAGAAGGDATGGGGAPGASCRALFQEFPSGTSGIPDPLGCGICDCNDGNFVCTDEACEIGVPVFPCPDEVTTDPIDVVTSRLEGDALVLYVGHGGGCESHDYGLCYSQGFTRSIPPQGSLTIVHDGHGDTCEAYLTTTLRFDLRPYAAFYNPAYEADGATIITNFGTYAAGALSCDERSFAAERQAEEVADQALASLDFTGPSFCTAPEECQWVSIATACTATCDAVPVPSNAAERLDGWLRAIDEHVCGAFEDDGCEPMPPPPCDEPPELACVSGSCEVVE
jgi:hypothetical protein